MATLWKKQSCTVLSVPGNLGQFKLSKHLWIIFFHALSALKRSTQLRISLVKYIFIFYQPSSSSLLKLPIYMVLQNPRDIFHKCANKYFFLRIEILIQFNHYYTATRGETDGSRFIKVWFSYPADLPISYNWQRSMIFYSRPRRICDGSLTYSNLRDYKSNCSNFINSIYKYGSNRVIWVLCFRSSVRINYFHRQQSPTNNHWLACEVELRLWFGDECSHMP